jgi:D,D-heptose 1,7-bisphosphate phosphatase
VEPAVFLDRDNTLIANDGDLGEPARVHLIDGVAEGLKSLRDAGFRLVVVTNQAGVARGSFSEADVDAVNHRIAELIDSATDSRGVIDRFYYCPYHPEGTVEEYRRDHPWRKPHPGMVLQAAHDMHLDLSQSWLIGDQDRDVAAGRAAGCRTILLTADRQRGAQANSTLTVNTFDRAVQAILTHRRNGTAVHEMRQGAFRPRAGREHVEDDGSTQRVLRDLVDELRAQRTRRGEFTPSRAAAALLQLLVLLMATLGMLQLENSEMFSRWMMGAVLVQLLVLSLLVLDGSR